MVIPALDEADNLPELIDEIRAALAGIDFEIIVADDASRDATPRLMAELGGDDPRIRTIRHRRTLGRSAGALSGVRAARAPVIVTIDGDGQNNPVEIPLLLARLDEPGVGLVAGQRLGRKDTWSKRIGSRIANAVRGAILGDDTRDTGCGLKAFRREDYLDLPYFDTMHRFLPALFQADGWRVAHVDVVDRPRRHGASKYTNLSRLMVGIPDLFGVWWLRRRRARNPVRFIKGLDT